MNIQFEIILKVTVRQYNCYKYRLLCQNTLYMKNSTPEVELCAVKLAIRVPLYTLHGIYRTRGVLGLE